MKIRSEDYIVAPLSIAGLIAIFFGAMGASGITQILKKMNDRTVTTDSATLAITTNCMIGYVIIGLVGACLLIAASIVYRKGKPSIEESL